MNCDEEKEDLDGLAELNKVQSVVSLWFLYFPHVLFIEASMAYLQLGAYYQSPI